MLRAILALSLSLSLSLSLPLAAQTICVTGVLQPLPGPTICMQGETHWLPDAEVFLRATGIDLNQYIGRTVTVHGVDIGLLCRVIDVRQVVDPAAVQLVGCGSQMIGCPFKVKVTGPGLGFAMLAASFTAGFHPLGCSNLDAIRGSLLLGLPAEVLLSGTTGSGSLELTIPIPLNNALVGVRVRFQGAHMTIGPVGPLELSNRVELVPGLLLPPCAPTNC